MSWPYEGYYAETARAGQVVARRTITCAGCMVARVTRRGEECQRLIDQGLCQKQVALRMGELLVEAGRVRLALEGGDVV